MPATAINPSSLARPARRHDRLSLFLFVYVAFALLVLLGAMSAQNNMLFWLVGVAMAAIIVSGFVAGPAMMGVRLAGISAPPFLVRGQDTVVMLRLANANRFRTAYALRIRATLTGPLEQSVSLTAGCAELVAGGVAEVPLRFSPVRRGVWRVRTLRVETTFPFGLSRKIVVFEPDSELWCLPETPAAASKPIGGARGMLMQSVARQREASSEGDPYGIRDYRPGDPKRRIAWRATARLGRLIVREHEPLETQTLWLRPEVSLRGLQTGSGSAERVLSQTVALAESLEQSGGRVGVWHPESGAASRPGDQASWRRVVASLGQRVVRESAGPRASTAVVPVGPEGAR